MDIHRLIGIGATVGLLAVPAAATVVVAGVTRPSHPPATESVLVDPGTRSESGRP